MITQVDEVKWELSFGSHYHSIYFDPSYLNIVKQSFDYQLKYYTFFKKGRLLFAAALFSKYGEIIVPYAFTYNSIYFDENINDITYLEIFGNLLTILKADYKRISLRLSPSIRDLRPFIWADFNVINRYTYYRTTSDLLANKILKKAKKYATDLNFEVNSANGRDIEMNLDVCFKYGLAKRLRPNYKSLFTELSKAGYLKSFCLFQDDDKLAVIQLCILDTGNKSLATISINELNNRIFVPFLNYKIFEWGTLNNIENVDMVGANDEGIANFKYSFNAKLTPYYLVHYNSREKMISNLFKKIKNGLKKILVK